jgi:protein ImuB
LPNWSVQRLRAERPDLRAGLLLVSRRDARRGDCVAACCDQAHRYGVRAGISLAEAGELVPADGCPAVAICSDEPAADLAALGRLAEHCELFSPRVGWETVVPRSVDRSSRRSPSWFGGAPSHLFLDVSGIPHLFGGEELLARQVITSCHELGYDSRLAIAGTLGASWAVAGVGEPIALVPPGATEPALSRPNWSKPCPASVFKRSASSGACHGTGWRGGSGRRYLCGSTRPSVPLLKSSSRTARRQSTKPPGNLTIRRTGATCSTRSLLN